MMITIEVTHRDLFNQLIDELDIMIPIYPFTKPSIYNIDWTNGIVKIFADGEYYNIFTSMLKKYIIDKTIKISINLPFYPIVPRDINNIFYANDDWIVNI